MSFIYISLLANTTVNWITTSYSFEQAAPIMLTWERPVSVSLARARSYPANASAALKKSTWSIRHRTGDIMKKTSHVPLHNFQGTSSTTDGKTDIVARPSGSWNLIRRFLERGCLSTRSSMSWESRPKRVLNVFSARVIWHSLSACIISELERSAGEICTCEFVAIKLSREGSSRDIARLLPRLPGFLFFYVSYPWSFFFGRLDDVG